jgi:hypothetical protein
LLSPFLLVFSSSSALSQIAAQVVVVERCNEIVGQVRDVVGGNLGRVGEVAVAALVGSDDVVARRDEGGHLMTRREGEIRPAVAEHDGLPGVPPACLEDLQLQAVDGDQGGPGKSVGFVSKFMPPT